jgi:hypothetical protein
MRSALAIVVLLVSPPAVADAADWQTTLFGGRPRPERSVHYRARVADRSKTIHAVEAWREPGRLRRSSDGVLDLYATRKGNGLSAVLVDKRSGRVFRADEAILLRVGHVESWDTLAYVLVRPGDELALRPAGRQRRISGATCQPYRVVHGEDTAYTFCWSARLRLPLQITTPDGQQAFMIDFVEERRAPEHVFQAPAPGVTDLTDDD